MSYSIAHTIPEEDRENYITEDEAKDMIKGFNSHLRNISCQVDELTKLNDNIQKKLEKETERNNNIRASIIETKQTMCMIETEIENKSQSLSHLEIKIHAESSKAFLSCNMNAPDLENALKDKNASAEALKQISDMLMYLSQLEAASIILQTQNELLNKKIRDKIDNMNTEVKCATCKDKYVPAKNHNNACTYHPGKLKYFSCRGCGADAYYDCCIRCKTCSKGCKTTHHTS
ncbi:hypothetical protein SteCoe_20920 [Stentor coeruleus]|uniref:Uncharacterized protein n=1 Tax=Stentor coeruleus TaxID=5963 RepID=A0A1R2BQM0_9CILI|nr:hypothetical protein SteCoe_20920 [Stentor coeruleus]